MNRMIRNSSKQKLTHRETTQHVCTHDNNGCGIVQDGKALLKPNGTRSHHND